MLTGLMSEYQVSGWAMLESRDLRRQELVNRAVESCPLGLGVPRRLIKV